MNLLVVQLGSARFAFAEHQVQAVGTWRGDAAGGSGAGLIPSVEIARALKLPASDRCERGLRVYSSKGTPLEFGVPGNIRQRSAVKGALTTVPRLLRRLVVPAWVAGFFRSDEEVATVIDLCRLADELDPDPQRRV